MKQPTEPAPIRPVPDYDPNEENGPMTEYPSGKKQINWWVVAVVVVVLAVIAFGAFKACH